mmetsp:Transcript_906/g.2703  ORF Transcript_906/g.2703 Transcript_906/m.2703 type:complete len:206 (+) Transcript_906:2577-3194(+)
MIKLSNTHGRWQVLTRNVSGIKWRDECPRIRMPLRRAVAIERTPANLHDNTAAVCLFRLAVEHLGIRAQFFRLGHQVVELFPSLEERVHILVQNVLSFIKLLVDLRDGIRFVGILVPHQMFLEIQIGRVLLVASPAVGTGVLGRKLIEHLADEGERHPPGILGIACHHANEPVLSTVGMKRHLILLHRLSRFVWCAFGNSLGEEP